MNIRVFKPFALLLILVMLTGLACSFSASTTTEPSPTAVPQEPTQVPAAPTDTPVPEPTAAPEGLITSRSEAEQAVVRIVAHGDYVYPSDSSAGAIYDMIGSGSGFIIDPAGIAITNNHVVTGANYIEVYFSGDSKAYDAKVLGVSECSDLAVIDIEGDGYPYLAWYEDTVDVDTDVWSAGYPLGDPQYSVHRGVISKRSASLDTDWASVENVLEHDATINPGNSGGPLLNENGQVVGVNYASSGEAVNQFYAIGLKEAEPILADLEAGKDVNSLGINGSAFVSEDGSFSGIWVYSVDTNSPAYKTGVRGGDIVTQLEGNLMGADGTLSEYCKILKGRDATDMMSLEVLRLSSGDVLAGELNGSKLETTGTFDTGGTTTTTTTNTYDDGGGFYLEEFDRTLDDWSYFFMLGSEYEDDVDIYTDNGMLTLYIDHTDVYAYLTYDKYTYTDVRIDTEAENLGRNNNNVSLLCRYNDNGWYEFNIANSGLYNIYRFDVNRNDYIELASGGSTLINIGQDTNTYTAVCQGDKLTLGINGVEVKTVRDKNLKEGQIGLSVSSFNVTPIEVNFNWFEISQP